MVIIVEKDPDSPVQERVQSHKANSLIEGVQPRKQHQTNKACKVIVVVLVVVVVEVAKVRVMVIVKVLSHFKSRRSSGRSSFEDESLQGGLAGLAAMNDTLYKHEVY